MGEGVGADGAALGEAVGGGGAAVEGLALGDGSQAVSRSATAHMATTDRRDVAPEPCLRRIRLV